MRDVVNDETALGRANTLLSPLYERGCVGGCNRSRFFRGIQEGVKYTGAGLIGFGVGMLLRSNTKSDPAIIIGADDKGTELGVFGIISCAVTLACCLIFTKQLTSLKRVCSSGKLLGRLVVRSAIPFVFSLGCMVAVKAIENKADGPDFVLTNAYNDRLFAASDGVGLLILLLSFKLTDHLLTRYWPYPYSEILTAPATTATTTTSFIQMGSMGSV